MTHQWFHNLLIRGAHLFMLTCPDGRYRQRRSGRVSAEGSSQKHSNFDSCKYCRIFKTMVDQSSVVMRGTFERQVGAPPLVDPVRRLEVRRRATVHRQHRRREQVQRLTPAASSAAALLPDAEQQVLDGVPRREPTDGAGPDGLHLPPVVEVPHVLGADGVRRVHEQIRHPRRQRRERRLAGGGAASSLLQDGRHGRRDEAAGDADALPHPQVPDPLHRRRHERRVEEERRKQHAPRRPGQGLAGQRRYGRPQRVARQPHAAVLPGRRRQGVVDGLHGGAEAGLAFEPVADELEVELQVPLRGALLGDGAAEGDDEVRGGGGGGGVEEVERGAKRVDGAEDGAVGGVDEHLMQIDVEEPPPRRRAGIGALPVPLPVALEDVHALDEARHDGAPVVGAVPGRSKAYQIQIIQAIRIQKRRLFDNLCRT
ncbi:unnamed protein product [Urochloa decumbens]|uniref:Uncharacterized protein n=1 Tax=Urochloa decumbens TaxID=240449 RepID=A0ABC8YTC3_9POAL